MVAEPSTVHQPPLLRWIAPRVAPPATLQRTPLEEPWGMDVGGEGLLGGDDLACRLMESVPWRQGRRKMWDRVLDDPRLSYWGPADDAAFDPTLAALQRELERIYRRPLRPPGLNYYRHGQDSVAWHADRELRELDDTLVAIVTLGTRRPFLVRPRHGGPSLDLRPGSGDLLVMGGATQRDWEHSVPKTARAGPR